MEDYKHYTALKETIKLYLEYKENYPTINLYENSTHDELAEYENQYLSEQISVSNLDYLKHFDSNYFFGCSSKVYKMTYQRRLNEFNAIFFDAEEIDFIKNELEEGSTILDFKFYFQIDAQSLKQITYSLVKRFEFLIDRASELGFNVRRDENIITDENVDNYKGETFYFERFRTKLSEETTVQFENKTLKWQGTELQLTELTKSLKESNLLNPELSQKVIFERFKEFMQVEKYNVADKLKEIRKRTKDKTPLLNILETSLNNWIIKKD